MTLGASFEQLLVFLLFWALYVVVCCAYLFGNGLCKIPLARHLFDGIFGVGVAIGTIWFNLRTNNGEFRIFLIVAMALGCTTAYFCFANALDKLSCKLYNLFTNKKVGKNGKDIL